MNEIKLLIEIRANSLDFNQFCKAIGLSEQSFYLRTRNKRSFKLSELKKIKEVLKLTPEAMDEIFFSDCKEDKIDRQLKKMLK